MLVLLSALVARADAAPEDDDEGDERGDAIGVWSDEDKGPRDVARSRLHVPITNEMIERIVTVAPPIASVVAAAYRAAGVAHDPTRGWRRRSRLSALIPYVSTRAGQNQAWRDVSDPTISHGVGMDVRASWRLDRLLYDPNEPRIEMLDVTRRRERRRVAAVAIHVYFDWVAARAAADRDVRAVLDVAEKTAELDALTAGWFSEALANRAELR